METVLVVAGSARMLAQAAKAVGLKALVIDMFADLDTRQYAEAFYQVASLAEADLAPAVDHFVEQYAVADVIYGSGFESHPESLYFLNSRLNVLGNTPDVFARQLDKPAFFSVLQRLGIPYPEVAFEAPNAGDWLVKPMQGQGGIGIKRYRARADELSVYWQIFQSGTPHSALFLADGRNAQLVGFNTQWSVRLSESQAFVFSGVMNHADLPERSKREITDWLRQIVPAFELKGLNSLDFIHEDGRSYLLEINPRPSASMQLYSPDLLARHIQAVGATSVAQKLDAGRLKSPLQGGYQIVYAERDTAIPDGFDWPEWCMDLPRPGSVCYAGQPICSVIARQKYAQSVVEQLSAQQQFILNKLTRGFDRHGIHSQR